MQREVSEAIGTTEEIGENVYTIAMVIPDMLENSIKLGKDIIVIPLSIIKDTTIFAADKVDQTVDLVV